MTSSRLPDRWEDALTLWEAEQRDADHAVAAIAKRSGHVRRFARAVQIDPWAVEHGVVAGYLQDLIDAGLAPNSVRTASSSLRNFYRWGVRRRKIFEDPTELPSRRATALPVPEAWAKPLRDFVSHERSRGQAESTIKIRTGVLRRFARAVPSLPPEKVTLDDLIDWLAPQAPHMAPEYRKLNRDALRCFFAWQKATGRAKKNPASKMRPPRGGVQQPRPVPDHLYEAAVAMADPRERLALRLAAELGLRRAEVCVVHSRDIVGSEGAWSLRVHGKGAKMRTVPLTFSLATSLRSRGEGFIFPGTFDGHLSPERMGKLLSALLPEGVTMHALRHRFATRAYNVDRDVFTVQQLLGHSSAATTQRYVGVSQDAMRRLVEAVAE